MESKALGKSRGYMAPLNWLTRTIYYNTYYIMLIVALRRGIFLVFVTIVLTLHQ